ncbi:hypothetical protein M5D96_007347 [Drosophila gunungcola]|uniref:Uncharacterized protein n=1 Tax=Drosophila gunungcola TaxID=103775 RepID=A0A9Q0BPL6_9MUSC|nr:hypothetical protein M5D96_007347 [Drosophila gunungcola]
MAGLRGIRNHYLRANIVKIDFLFKFNDLINDFH